MLRGRSVIPDIDVFGSPFLSPARSGPLSDVPGSAIAERIFNDPDSWDDTSGDEGDYPEDIENDTIAWLTEEIEKIRGHSAGVGGSATFDFNDSKKRDNSLTPNVEANAGWKNIARRSTVRPISLAGLFEQPNENFSKEIQQHLSKILNSSGIRHHIGPRPLSSPYSAAGLSAPNTADSSAMPTPASSFVDDVPLAPCPPSATLSFLEFYGIYPESPLVDGRKSLLPRKKTIRKAAQNKEIPSQPSPSTVNIAAAPPTFKSTATKRRSSIPPPALDLPKPHYVDSANDLELRGNPPGLTKPTSRTSHQLPTPPASRNNSQEQEGFVASSFGSDSSPRSRPLPTAAPPPYVANISSLESSRSSTLNITSPSARALPTAATPVRRLPSLPTVQTVAQPSQQSISSIVSRRATPSPGLASRVATPPPSGMATWTTTTPPRKSSAPTPATTSAAWSFGSFSLTSSTSTSPTPQSLFSARSPSTVRSPLSVPLGPRTRARSSDAGRPIATI